MTKQDICTGYPFPDKYQADTEIIQTDRHTRLKINGGEIPVKDMEFRPVLDGFPEVYVIFYPTTLDLKTEDSLPELPPIHWFEVAT